MSTRTSGGVKNGGSVPIPLRLQTHDLLGVIPPKDDASDADRLLAAVYGIMQIILSGVPPLTDSGRSDAAIGALLRDAAISTAGCLTTARAKLYEPTVRVSRGVLEARLYVECIRQSKDPEETAAVFTVDRLNDRKRNLQNSIDAGLRESSDPWAKRQLRDIEDALAAPQLDRAAAAWKALRKAGRQWHGAKSLRSLAAQLSDPGAYHLIYAPMSAFFVHPGDPATHLMVDGTDVVVRPLGGDDLTRLRSAMISTAQEGYRLIAGVTENWSVGAEIRVAVDLLLPLMLISTASPSLEGDDVANLEAQCGIPRAEWVDLVSVRFDWPRPISD